MRHASLFSGIGGFDLAARWMGWENVFWCDNDAFCQKVLAYHFPSSHPYGDIRTIDGTQWRGRVDILTGGFPCQPFSAIGRQSGTADDRYLWPEMLRVIREVQSAWVVAENVGNILNIQDGLVFEQVCSDMEAEGYEVQPFVIPACGVNAPHKRNRVWFLACHPERTGLEGHARNGGPETGRQEPTRSTTTPDWCSHWSAAATRLCRVDDGLPRELDGITVPRWRKESLKAYGNAIVPQVAYRIFQAIEAAS